MRTSDLRLRGIRRVARGTLPGLLALLTISACEQPDSPDMDPGVAEEQVVGPQSLEDMMETTIVLQQVNGSGVSGEALALRSEGTAVIAVDLVDLPEEGEYNAHVHRGTCEQGGPVAVGLNPVIGLADGTGSSTTTLDFLELEQAEGSLFIQVHGETGVPISCGNLFPEDR